MITPLLIIMWLAGIFYFIFLIKIYSGLKRINNSNERIDLNSSSFVSIIIPFRNESKNILTNLKSIQDIDYDKSKYEVIYVNDNSVDDSVEKLKKNVFNKNIRIVSVKSNNIKQGHKKIAVNYGINLSKGDIIITTDADCVVPVNWLKIIINEFDNNTAFVSGAVKFTSNGSLWHKLQQIEFSGLVLAGGGLIKSNKPIICNAANIAFRKDVFNKVGGYSDNLNLSSGDDELLMQKIHNTTDYQVKFIFDENAIVSTEPNESINEFYYQRKRWASKGVHYKSLILVITLISIYLYFLSLPIQIFLGLFYNKIFLISFVLSILIKSFIELRIIKIGEGKLIDKLSLKTFLIAEMLHTPYIILAGFLGLLGNFKWKERNLER